MTRKTRRILFLVLFVLFFLIAPSVVLYSQGWRLDLETKRIVKIGGFYFKVLPTRATVYISGKEKAKTDFFFGSAFIGGLMPKEYEIEIKKEGYLAWKKLLKVEEEKTTSAKNVLLFPQEPHFEILAKEIQDFVFSQDQTKMILFSSKKPWELKLFDLKENLISHLIEEKNIKKGAELEKVLFSPEANKILIETAAKERINYSVLDLTKTPFDLASADFLNSETTKIVFNPKNPNKVFFLKRDNLLEGDLVDEKVSILLEEVVDFQIEKDSMYYLDQSGFVFKTDLTGQKKEKLNYTAFSRSQEKKCELFIALDFVFLKEDEGLFVLDDRERSFKKFFDGLKGLATSPDARKLAFFSDHEIWLLFLKKIEDQPQREKGEKLFLARFSEKIGQVFWYNSDYLIFNVNGQVKIAEIDNRDKIQIWDLKNIEGQNIFFNQKNKKLYFLQQNNLFASQQLP